jgi:hypothetical protein
MKKLSKTEVQRRKEFSKDLQKELKKISRNSMWSHSRTILFKNLSENFLEANVSTHPQHYYTLVEIKFKPMTLDPLFWDIVLTPENKSQPLSFRAFGAWVSPSITLGSVSLDDRDIQPQVLAHDILNFVNKKTEQLSYLSMDYYLTQIESMIKSDRDTNYLASKITALIFQNKVSEASDLCKKLISKNYICGFSIGNMTFPELAIEHIEKLQKR